MPTIKIINPIPSTTVTLMWIVLAVLILFSIAFRKRVPGDKFVVWELITFILMVIMLFAYFVPIFGW